MAWTSFFAEVCVSVIKTITAAWWRGSHYARCLYTAATLISTLTEEAIHVNMLKQISTRALFPSCCVVLQICGLF